MGTADVLPRPQIPTTLPELEAPQSARRAPRAHFWSQEWQKGNSDFPLATGVADRRPAVSHAAHAEQKRTGSALPALAAAVGPLPPLAVGTLGVIPTPPKEKRRTPSRIVPEGRSATRRNSQATFADRRQTMIILDWDDTLFPTSHVRDSSVPDRAKLARAAAAVEQLLRLAATLGEVRIVTLAKVPWVTTSCEHFFPGLKRLFDQFAIKIVYAACGQDGSQIDYSKVSALSDVDRERFLSHVKGRAIGRELREFYTQYEGQTWKNVISIGDSTFERAGTHYAVKDYMDAHGLLGKEPNARGVVEANGHAFKVRSKTFKLIETPTIDEVVAQVGMLQQWLPMMVRLDASCDLELTNLQDMAATQAIEDTLQGRREPSQVRSAWP